jgi:hypothetical protein
MVNPMSALPGGHAPGKKRMMPLTAHCGKKTTSGGTESQPAIAYIGQGKQKMAAGSKNCYRYY